MQEPDRALTFPSVGGYLDGPVTRREPVGRETRNVRSMGRAARPDSGQPTPPRAAGTPRLTAGDFAAHFAESFRLLWLIAVGITRDRALSEDIVQDAAVIALRKLDEF